MCGLKSVCKNATAHIRQMIIIIIIIANFQFSKSTLDIFFLIKCSCGSVVKHCMSSAKGCGFNSQGTHILIKHIIACKSLWIKASGKCKFFVGRAGFWIGRHHQRTQSTTYTLIEITDSSWLKSYCIYARENAEYFKTLKI